MAATDKPLRNQKTLDYVFAISCILLLLSTLWMLVQDFNREFKTVQREFRDVETVLNERLMLEKLPDKSIVDEKQKAVADARMALKEKNALLEGEKRRLSAERERNDNEFRTIKADYDARMSYRVIAVDELSKAESELIDKKGADRKALEAKVSELRDDVAVRDADLDRLKQRLDSARRKLDATDSALREAVSGKLADLERRLSDSEDDLKRLTSAFDRFAKLTVQRQWGWSDAIRKLPIIDGFESPTKINQIVLPDLTIDYGGFRDVPRYDRCNTCHLAIDRSAFTKDALEKLDKADGADQTLKLAKEVLINRQKSGEALGFDPSNLPDKARTVNLTAAQVTQFCAHPRMDLFVDTDSKHPMEKFGCTSCHAGQGSATDFLMAAHTPNNAKQEKNWEHERGWKSSHFWDFPMLSNRFIESTCLKCHHQVTDLISQGIKPEAAKLLKGYNLLRENGCFGCHEIAGLKAGKPVGPDLRLEPTPPLDWLTASEQNRAKADPTNPPGAYRKVGPALRRIEDKTTETWTRKWLLSPRSFRDDTRMPHFYGLSTNSPEALAGTGQEKFPAAEIHGITHYLFAESKAGLQGTDTARKALLGQLTELHNKLIKGSFSDKEKKELLEVTRRIADQGLLTRPDRAAEINAAYVSLKQSQDHVFELFTTQIYRWETRMAELEKLGDLANASQQADLARVTEELEKVADDRARIKKEISESTKALDTKTSELLPLCRPIRLEEEIVLGDGTKLTTKEVDQLFAPDPDAKAQDARRINGRVLFSEKGCLACHSNDGTAQPAPGATVIVSEANFGPNLSRMAAKIRPDKEGKRWLLQWILNPNVHFPRTRMPITHLKGPEARDIAEWLLSQRVTDYEEKDPADPDRLTLVRLARVYLAKAQGMTMRDVDKFLPDRDAEAADKAPGIPAERIKFLPPDADERELLTAGENKPVDDNKLKWYIGKKSIGRLGCYGCHDIPGFETAKPIGTALNEWGKKDGDRLAFEDSDAFVKKNFHLAELLTDPANPKEPAKSWEVKDEKKPFEKYFLELMEHHQREGFLYLKLMDPRSFDYNRLRSWDDRLRMPQFQFSRVRKGKEENDEEFEREKTWEEAKAREEVMTFVLGLVGEQIAPKYLNYPNPDKLAVVKGRLVLDKFNCAGCHQIRPGMYDFNPSPITRTLLEEQYRDQYVEKTPGGLKDDYHFANHNAWVGPPSLYAHKKTAYGVNPLERKKEDTDKPENRLSIRLTDALRFTGNDGVERDLPAGININIVMPTDDPPLAGDLLDSTDPYGGTFADLLSKEYLPRRYSTKYANADSARAVLPPPLIREGERVQPRWLYQFLLDPGIIRAENFMLLRMPKFNMSPEDAQTLANYFGSVDKLANPPLGLTSPYLAIPQREEKYSRDRTADYARVLGKERVEAKVKAMDPIWVAVAQQQLDEAKNGLAAARAALPTAPADKKSDIEKAVSVGVERVKKLREQIEKKDYSELSKRFETSEIYAADAFRLLTNPSLCLQCHDVGKLRSADPKGPNLQLAAERLRPDWTLEWIANPSRMFPYLSVMPVNFPRSTRQYNEIFQISPHGTPFEQVQAVRDLLMDLPRLQELPAMRPPPAPPAMASGVK